MSLFVRYWFFCALLFGMLLIPGCSCTSKKETTYIDPQYLVDSSTVLPYPDLQLVYSISDTETLVTLTPNQPAANLLGITDSFELRSALTSNYPLNLAYVVSDPSGQQVYFALDLSQENASRAAYQLFEKENCSIYQVNKLDNVVQCALNNILIDNKSRNSAWLKTDDKYNPIQFDEAGNAYFLAEQAKMICDEQQLASVIDDVGVKHFLYDQNSRIAIADVYENGDPVCEMASYHLLQQEIKQIFKLLPNGDIEKIAVPNEAILSFIVFPDGKLVYKTQSISDQKPRLFFRKTTEVEEIGLPEEGLQQYTIVNDTSLLWNGLNFVNWSDNTGLEHLTLFSGRNKTGKAFVSNNGNIYHKTLNKLYQLLPYHPQPVAEIPNNSLELIQRK